MPISRKRSNEALHLSAVQASPSWNVTPGRDLEGEGRVVGARFPRIGQHRIELRRALSLEHDQRLMGADQDPGGGVAIGGMRVEVGR